MIRTRQEAGLSWLVTVLLLLTTAAPALAQDGLDRFVGRFRGTAEAESSDRFFVVPLRDVAMELQREGDGFRLAWSTLIRPAENAADGGAPRLRATELHFVPGPSPGTYLTRAGAEPFNGRPGAWATLVGNRLTVQVLAIDAAGGWEMQTYERTLEGDVMTLRFTRLAPGRPELVVTGRLTRQSP
jgi:hypothetical protein